MLALPPGGTLAIGGWDRRGNRSRASARRYVTNPHVWIEVRHVTISSKPVARFDGTMYARMDQEVPLWTTASSMIVAGRPCTNADRRQSPPPMPTRTRHAAAQPPPPPFAPA